MLALGKTGAFFFRFSILFAVSVSLVIDDDPAVITFIYKVDDTLNRAPSSAVSTFICRDSENKVLLPVSLPCKISFISFLADIA